MKENEAIEVLEGIETDYWLYETIYGGRQKKALKIAVSLLKQYAELGTVEELREAMEKQRAKKPIRVSNDRTDGCPICKREFYER